MDSDSIKVLHLHRRVAQLYISTLIEKALTLCHSLTRMRVIRCRILGLIRGAAKRHICRCVTSALHSLPAAVSRICQRWRWASKQAMVTSGLTVSQPPLQARWSLETEISQKTALKPGIFLNLNPSFNSTLAITYLCISGVYVSMSRSRRHGMVQ